MTAEPLGPIVVTFDDSSPVHLTIDAGSATISTGTAVGDPDLVVRCPTGSTVGAVIEVRQGNATPEILTVSRPGGAVVRHVPFDIGPEPPRVGVPGCDLLVQHAKHGSLVGTIRYYERFRDGVLVERESGIAGGADVIIQNSFPAMIRALRSDDLAADFGGAQVRARDQSALVQLAGVYTNAEFIRHLRTFEPENYLLARVAEVMTPELLAAMVTQL